MTRTFQFKHDGEGANPAVVLATLFVLAVFVIGGLAIYNFAAGVNEQLSDSDTDLTVDEAQTQASPADALAVFEQAFLISYRQGFLSKAKEGAAEGNLNAMFVLGLVHQYGELPLADLPFPLNVDIDYEEAAKWFAQGAELEHGPSMVQLGLLHFHELIPDARSDYGLSLIRKAEELRSRSAHAELAGLSLQKRIADYDALSAITSLETLIANEEAGKLSKYKALPYALEARAKREGAFFDYEKAVAHTRALAQMEPHSGLLDGYVVMFEQNAPADHRAEAADGLELLASLDDGTANLLTGYMYASGDQRDRDEQRAVAHYMRAAELGVYKGAVETAHYFGMLYDKSQNDEQRADYATNLLKWHLIAEELAVFNGEHLNQKEVRHLEGLRQSLSDIASVAQNSADEWLTMHSFQ